MTNIDIFSGFLGAGKTTLIKKLIKESFAGQKVVLIENEFGEIGIDGGFLKESGIQINELNAGCICCSLVGDFRAALQQVVEQYHPDRIVIEPSGVGKLSDVTRAVEGVAEHLDVKLNSFVTVADVNKVKMYMKNFGEFYDDQISHASCIILSRTQTASEEKIAAAVAMLREKNPTATIVFVDDLAFNDSCPEYTALKTVLEGGLEARPSNVVVYATSNRRNIVRQRFSERQDDVNERDTLEEKFSLADRFDLRLTFSAPTQEEYFTICRALLDARGAEYDWDELMPRARAWTVSHNGCSPRIARQFVDYIAGEGKA